MKIVHAADLHLGSPLCGLPVYREGPLEAFRRATQRALERLVELCQKEGADLLVLAGDLVDARVRDHKVGLHLVDQLLRLIDQGTQVVIVRGNHDASSRVARNLLLPAEVVELRACDSPTVVLERQGVAVHGIGYKERSERRCLLGLYPRPLAGLFNLGILHTSLEGHPGHECYAPCRLQALRHHGYDYWALGHVHTPAVLSAAPWVVFPGNLQARSMREQGPRGAVLVTLTEGQVAHLEHRATDAVRFAICRVDVSQARSFDQVAECAQRALVEYLGTLGDRALVVRFLLHGLAGPGKLACLSPEARVHELRQVAAELGEAPVWVEGVWIDLTPVSNGLLADSDSQAHLLSGLE